MLNLSASFPKSLPNKSASETSVSAAALLTSVPTWTASPLRGRNDAGLVAQSSPELNKERY